MSLAASSSRTTAPIRERLRDGHAATARPARRWTCPSPNRRRPARAEPAGRRPRAGRGSRRQARARPKKSAASASSNARSPLYGFGSSSAPAGSVPVSAATSSRHELRHRRAGRPSTSRGPGRRQPRHASPGQAPLDQHSEVVHVIAGRSGRIDPPKGEVGDKGRRRRSSNITLSALTRPCTIPASAAATSAPPMRPTSVASASFVSGPRPNRSASVPPCIRRITR